MYIKMKFFGSPLPLLSLVLIFVWITLVRVSSAATYPKLDYESAISKIRKLAHENKDIIKYEDGALKYKKKLHKLQCGDFKCKYPILTITNFNSSKHEINHRPQSIILGGIHGDEVTSQNTAVYLLQWICKLKNTRFWDVLNSQVLVLVPIANARGFYQNLRVRLLIFILLRIILTKIARRRHRPQQRLPLCPGSN